MTRKASRVRGKIAFQGAPGANSDLACRAAYPGMETLPCAGFEDAFEAVQSGRAKLAMIPIENTVMGRVADVHQLLPHANLHIVGEHFERIEHQLLAPKGATLKTIKTIESQVPALDQCRIITRKLGLKRVVAADTAAAAAEVARAGDITRAAIASKLAGKIYGLKTLMKNVEDAAHNTTRFIVLSKKPVDPDPRQGKVVTTFVFRVRNVPAALYKAMGGFATNGVNMTKLESYMIGGRFTATLFYSDVEGHPKDRNLALALDELRFFSREVKVLGVYHAHPSRP